MLKALQDLGILTISLPSSLSLFVTLGIIKILITRVILTANPEHLRCARRHEQASL